MDNDHSEVDSIEIVTVEQHQRYEEQMARQDWTRSSITVGFKKALEEKYESTLLNAIVSRRLNDNDRALGLLSFADGLKSALDLISDYGSNQQQ